MATGFVIRKNEYYDSVFLMRIAKSLADEPGVQQSAVVMATVANKSLLKDLGFSGAELDQASPNDLVVALAAAEPGVIETLLADLEGRLRSTAVTSNPANFTSIEAAVTAHPETNLAVISVPGEHAARETRKALEQGKHVFLFSNNVPLDQETVLKQLARNLGLLVMGPDCGTSILQGIGLGFANVVRRGPVGVVGASGTGLQEFTCQVHQAGSGISHAIGAGTHDLYDAVGGITTLMGLEALERDPGTQVIAIVSKPAQPATLSRLIEWIRRCQKPVIGCFLGLEQAVEGGGPNLKQAWTIDEAVQLALAAVKHTPTTPPPAAGQLDELAAKLVAGWLPHQRYLRGLFAGGTFCYQSQQVLRGEGITAYSNSPLDIRYRLEKPEDSLEHTLIDMGDDHFTQGKPHPMIDAGQRRSRLLAEAADPEVAVVLLDFILGYIASPNPAGDLAEAIHKAKEKARVNGGSLSVIASVCGTDQDPQDLERQKAILGQAGALVFPSNAQAARFCARLIRAAQGAYHGSRS